MSGKKRIPSPDELRDYNYAVAGHAGTLCDEDGELFIKPCTQSELNWYQTVEEKGLRDFAEVMPVYMGELRLSDPQDVDDAVIDLISDAGASDVKKAKEHLKASIKEQVARTAKPCKVSKASKPAKAPTLCKAHPAQKESEWVPGKGARIKTDRAVVLENASYGFKRANILDVKLGVRLWADDAPPEKKRRFDVITSETTHATLGFRIAGMRVYRGSENETEWDEEDFKVYDKEYGKTRVNNDNVVDEFRKFVFNKEAGIDDDLGRAVCSAFVRDLDKVEQVLLQHETRMYSSSLLFLFEGDGAKLAAAIQENNDIVDEALGPAPDSPGKLITRTNTRMDSGIVLEDEDSEDGFEDDFSEPSLPQIYSLKLIDFAHADFTPGQGPDENSLIGVRSLRRIFRQLAGEDDE